MLTDKQGTILPEWTAGDLESIERVLTDLVIPDAELGENGDNYPVERIEFDLRHAREHLGKLKFNFLELATKRRFLEHLLDSGEWEAIPEQWAPGPVKALERRVQDAKDSLKHVKEQQAAIKAEVERLCEVFEGRLAGVKGKREEAVKLAQHIRATTDELSQVRAALPQDDANGCWSVEELRGRLEGATVAREKRLAALSVQQQAVSDLHRLLHHQSDQLARLRQLSADRAAQLSAVQAKQGGAGAAVKDLCQWYRGMHELCEGMTGVHCDVVRPNYLHVTVTNPSTAQSVPIHLHVDRRTGKLQSATIGSTASTPKMQWRELIDLAVANNDISFLIRQVHYRLIRSG